MPENQPPMVNQATGISGVEARPYERAARVDVAEQRDVRDVDQSSRVDLLAFLQQDDTARFETLLPGVVA